MNLRRLGAIVLKELRQLRRDKLTFVMIAGVPLLELVLREPEYRHAMMA